MIYIMELLELAIFFGEKSYPFMSSVNESLTGAV